MAKKQKPQYVAFNAHTFAGNMSAILLKEEGMTMDDMKQDERTLIRAEFTINSSIRTDQSVTLDVLPEGAFESKQGWGYLVRGHLWHPDLKSAKEKLLDAMIEKGGAFKTLAGLLEEQPLDESDINFLTAITNKNPSSENELALISKEDTYASLALSLLMACYAHPLNETLINEGQHREPDKSLLDWFHAKLEQEILQGDAESSIIPVLFEKDDPDIGAWAKEVAAGRSPCMSRDAYVKTPHSSAELA